MAKAKPIKNQSLTVNLKHDGVFTLDPFEYLNEDEKQITYICFEGTPLRLGLTALKNDVDGDAFINLSYQNKWVVDLLESKCPNFKNGICESFNRAILVQRTKPIITMLKDIILYLMQRLVSMNRIARTLEDTITPSIRKRIEFLKEEQRFWMVIPSSFQEIEVRKGHGAYGVNLQLRTCMCRMWQLSGLPCIHSVAAYCHMNRDLVEGVDHWYSQKRWYSQQKDR
ncbi:agenet domain-containing protein [Tanacetum coccineum]